MLYKASCHCGNIKFEFESNKITDSLKCNCSICRRKNAFMTNFTIPPDKFKIIDNSYSLGTYDFGNKIAKHHFCKNCGIYTFHQTFRQPGHYRVNIGCLEDITLDNLAVVYFDGASL